MFTFSNHNYERRNKGLRDCAIRGILLNYCHEKVDKVHGGNGNRRSGRLDACGRRAARLDVLRIRSAASNTLIVSPRNDHENAFLNGVSNAETLDLRGTITSPDGETTYTISHIAQFALGADPTKSTPRAFIAPTTVNGGLYGWFNGITNDVNGTLVAEQNANYTNITIDIPGWFEGIDYYQVPRTSGDLNWTLKLPQLRYVNDGAFTRYLGGAAASATTR